jgi:hypothetical protein
MKIHRIFAFCFALITATLSSQLTAASETTADVHENPGFFDVERLLPPESLNVKSEVYLQNHILRMIARMTRSSEPEFSGMLDAIQLLRVLHLDFSAQPPDRASADISKLFQSLSSGKWETLVRNRDADRTLHIAVQTDGEGIVHALVILTALDTALTVVNLVGAIDLDQLTRMGSQFNIPELNAYPATAE